MGLEAEWNPPKSFTRSRVAAETGVARRTRGGTRDEVTARHRRRGSVVRCDLLQIELTNSRLLVGCVGRRNVSVPLRAKDASRAGSRAGREVRRAGIGQRDASKPSWTEASRSRRRGRPTVPATESRARTASPQCWSSAELRHRLRPRSPTRRGHRRARGVRRRPRGDGRLRHDLRQADLRAFEGRILNTHPALLPALHGLARRAGRARRRREGHRLTVHVATLEVDAGPILAQEAVRV